MNLDNDTIDAIARRVVELLEPRLAAAGITTTPDPDSAAHDPGRESAVLTDAAVDLAEWVTDHRPEWLQSLDVPLADWAQTMVGVSDHATAVDVVSWAFADQCPTTYWQRTYAEIAVPATSRTSRGKPRYGPWLQLISEHKLSTGPDAHNLGHVDAVVEHITDQVNTIGSKQAAITPSARRNALQALYICDGDPDRVLAIIDWCLAHKPHWRSTLTGAPRAETFRKMRGDWIAAGQEFSLGALPDEAATQIRNLADGWCYHLSSALEQQVTASPATLQRIHTLLTGGDRGPAMSCETVKAVALWICAPDEGRTRFYVDGLDFPRPDRMRKALLDMRSGGSRPSRSSTVADTNLAAADRAVDTADDDLKGML